MDYSIYLVIASRQTGVSGLPLTPVSLRECVAFVAISSTAWQSPCRLGQLNLSGSLKRHTKTISVITSQQCVVSNLSLTTTLLQDCVSNRGNPITLHRRSNPPLRRTHLPKKRQRKKLFQVALIVIASRAISRQLAVSDFVAYGYVAQSKAKGLRGNLQKLFLTSRKAKLKIIFG
ncbi:MAG: hypothetical protein IJM09_02330 [Neisseriaceae bacterium]|nr:hypothetical protein [Neisseriaceae bacterium]